MFERAAELHDSRMAGVDLVHSPRGELPGSSPDYRRSGEMKLATLEITHRPLAATLHSIGLSLWSALQRRSADTLLQGPYRYRTVKFPCMATKATSPAGDCASMLHLRYDAEEDDSAC
jgi:hypothetical protein